MEWDSLKIGNVIKWNMCFAKDYDPITVLIEEKRDDNEFGCTMLSGCRYSNKDYRELFLPSVSMMGFIGLRREKFEKHKEEIVPASATDEQFIDSRLEAHVRSYYNEYRFQKIWADNLKKRTEKYFQSVSESEEKGKEDATH